MQMRSETDKLNCSTIIPEIRQRHAAFFPFVFLLVFLLAGTTAYGDEGGLSTTYREIGRLHSDSDSIGSKITIRRHELFLNIENQKPFTFLYRENREHFSLTHPDGTRYFTFDFQWHRPRLRYRTDSYDLDFSLPVLNVESDDELYTRIETDNQNVFVLPALFGRYRISNWEFHLGGWDETDIQPFNYYRYTLYVFRTASVGGNCRFPGDQSIEMDYRIIDRIYPRDYNLKKDEIEFAYRKNDLLDYQNKLHWRELSLQLIQTRYPDLDANKVDLTNRFKFKLAGLDHFLTYRIRYTDMITTYREGVYPYSLIETDENKEDLWQYLEYAGFWRIPGSRFFLSWQYRLEDSLVKNVILDQAVQLKLAYAF